MVSRADTTDPAAPHGFPGLASEIRALHARPLDLAVLELNPHALSADKARALLRKLRDLNLSTGPVAITRDMAVFLGGCLSLDFPAETGGRYRARPPARPAPPGPPRPRRLARTRCTRVAGDLGPPRARAFPATRRADALPRL